MNRLVKILFALAIVGGLSSPSAFAEEKGLTVFAAASMKNALDECDAAYSSKTGVKVVASYAASSVLAKQIEQGAPADIFLSADTDWMNYAAKQKAINTETRTNLLGNSIVLIAPKDSSMSMRDFARECMAFLAASFSSLPTSASMRCTSTPASVSRSRTLPASASASAPPPPHRRHR